ncbi:MAG: sugar phosphate isomerase/epimerase [Opitutaceae bacterium]|nr:sugar phosphate isomerase/epimerase [Opitutaceae bacterium]
MKTLTDLGVQSFCFRDFKDNAEVAAKVSELGLNKIEVCGVHADFNDLKSWKKILKTYEDNAISVVSIGVQTFTGEDSEEAWFESAIMAGAKHISAHFAVDSFTKTIEKVRNWCQKYEVKIGIHNHGGYAFGGQFEVMTHLIELGSPEIGLCLDTAWCLQIGPHQGKPEEWVETFHENLYGVHFKDFTFDSNGQWHDTVIGEGNLDFPLFMKTLHKHNFEGIGILEFEGNPSNPVPELKLCLEKMRPYLG